MSSNVKKLFGEKVRVLRRNLGYSQEEFSARVGLANTYITEIENGKRNPSLDAIEAIATCLGVSIASMFDDIERV